MFLIKVRDLKENNGLMKWRGKYMRQRARQSGGHFMNMEETAIFGWKAIAALFNVSERKMRYLKQELQESGVIFYMRVGRPPKRRICAFPSRLKVWAALKSTKHEVF
jgi:hypothetical protein